MYTIHADGQLLFASGSETVESIAFNPKLSLDVENSASLTFVLPPGNRMHGKLKKLKHILTIEQDGKQLARCRVTETENDNYNQQSVYCEGDKAFLRDSVHAPYSYEGTVHGLFQKLLDNHNANVEAEKQFALGVITAVSAEETTEVLCDVYSATADEMDERLLSAYGGYLRTRTEGNTHYLDWVEQYGDENQQPIEFGVNLLDLTDKADASDVFTVLIPLGASGLSAKGEYDEPLTIAEVNNGLNYIQDDEAVALYGKIWRTYTWSHVEDAATLLEKGREYMRTGIALETLTLKAVDMHFVDGNIQPIRLGDRVRILSNPHGLDKVMVCTQIEIDLLNPENTLYTFGEKPRTLTDNVVLKEKGGGGGGSGGRQTVEEEINDIVHWARIITEEQNAHIQLTAGEFNRLNGNLSAVEIEMNGIEAEIAIAASRLDEVEGRTTSAEIAIDGANATIQLHASELSDLSQSMTQAEIAIDGLNSEIRLKADKIDLEGYVTIDDLNSTNAAISNLTSGLTQAQVLKSSLVESITGTFQFLNASLFTLAEKRCVWTSKAVLTSIPEFTKATVTLANGNQISVVTGWAEAPSNKRSTLQYLSYS